MSWLKQPMVLQRWHLLGSGLFVGLLLAGALLGAHLALVGVRHERNQRIAEAESALRREQLTQADVKAIAKRTARLEQPTRKQLLRRIHHAQRVCLGSPTCRRLASQVQHDVVQETPRPPAPSRRSNPQPQRQRPGRPQSPKPSAPGPSTQPQRPPPPQRPPVDVHTPPSVPVPPVSLCTPLVDVNCP
jgi:hypothetical protein